MLRDELHADKGDVELPAQWRIAHVAQETPALERPAVEYAIDGDAALRAVEENLRNAEAANDGARMAELHGDLADADVYTARPRAESLLLGLGFKVHELEKPVSTFSGGWRMRLNLAQALMCRSDLLLLDEPTNHLDLDAIIWLEDWLRRYPGTLIVIRTTAISWTAWSKPSCTLTSASSGATPATTRASRRSARRPWYSPRRRSTSRRASARTCSRSSTASAPRRPRRARRKAA